MREGGGMEVINRETETVRTPRPYNKTRNIIAGGQRRQNRRKRIFCIIFVKRGETRRDLRWISSGFCPGKRFVKTNGVRGRRGPRARSDPTTVWRLRLYTHGATRPEQSPTLPLLLSRRMNGGVFIIVRIIVPADGITKTGNGARV